MLSPFPSKPAVMIANGNHFKFIYIRPKAHCRQHFLPSKLAKKIANKLSYASVLIFFSHGPLGAFYFQSIHTKCACGGNKKIYYWNPWRSQLDQSAYFLRHSNQPSKISNVFIDINSLDWQILFRYFSVSSKILRAHKGPKALKT